jgi:hypothetical protein
MDNKITLIKCAWIREPSSPIGQPAKGRFNCPCGDSPLVNYTEGGADIICNCGRRFSWDGFILAENIFDAMIKRDHNPDTRTSWTEATEKEYDYALGVLPPIRWDGSAFMMGECETGDERGAIYAAFVESGGRFFGKLEPIRNFDPARYKKEIRQQFKINQEAEQ